MAAPYEEMGYQLKLFVGTAGQEAATQVEKAVDVDYDLGTATGETTDRGTGGLPPIQYENVTKRIPTVTWNMNNDPDDAVTLILIAAAAAGTPVSIKVTTGSGVELIKGDVNLKKKYNAPLAGPGTYDFTATMTKQAGRTATLG